MPKMIFVNLPVADLAKSKAFYEALGFTPEPRFSDETGAAMVWSETIFVMILTHEKWKGFTDRPIAPRGSSEVSLALSLDSREAVDAMIEAGAAHGGTADVNPVQDHGFMYGRDLLDPDGQSGAPSGWTPRSQMARRRSPKLPLNNRQPPRITPQGES